MSTDHGPRGRRRAVSRRDEAAVREGRHGLPQASRHYAAVRCSVERSRPPRDYAVVGLAGGARLMSLREQVDKLTDELRIRDRRIAELKRDLDKERDLTHRLDEHLRDCSDTIDAWKRSEER